MVFVDHDSKNIVFAIRGTFAINDLVIDALCDEVPFLDGFAHRGMVNVSKYYELALDKWLIRYAFFQKIWQSHFITFLWQGAKEILSLSATVVKNAFEKYQDYNLLITGHSLGGGTAELAAMSFIYDPQVATLLPTTSKVHCVVLAPPPVFRRSDGEHRYSKLLSLFW